jgi:hypothetical protein
MTKPLEVVLLCVQRAAFTSLFAAAFSIAKISHGTMILFDKGCQVVMQACGRALACEALTAALPGLMRCEARPHVLQSPLNGQRGATP